VLPFLCSFKSLEKKAELSAEPVSYWSETRERSFYWLSSIFFMEKASLPSHYELYTETPKLHGVHLQCSKVHGEYLQFSLMTVSAPSFQRRHFYRRRWWQNIDRNSLRCHYHRLAYRSAGESYS